MAAPSLLSSSSIPKFLMQTLTLTPPPFSRTIFSPLKTQLSTLAVGCRVLSTSPTINPLPISGSEDALMGFVTGKRKATEVAHSAWKNLVRKGDTVIDATCGNGYDTLALLKMVADESGRGCVYGMDIQSSALESTSSLLEVSTDENERKQVQLHLLCHTKMEEVVPRDTRVRLVAFNLGYLPGGDKTIITRSSTTLLALQAASRILDSGGLISIVAYVGHPGGRDEYETVESFASSLPMESWIGCKFEMLNRPTCPVLLFLFKK